MIKRRLRLKRELQYEMLLLPALIGYILFFIYPTIGGFYYSLTDWSAYSRDFSFVGLENFKRLLTDGDILQGIKNTFIYALLMTIFQNGFAIPVAVALDKNLKTRNLLRMIFFAPAVLSPLIVGYLWSYIMSSTDYGLINKILVTIGLEKVNWLGDTRIALYSVLGTQVWQWCGWSMVIYLANLQSIPKSLYEAATIDGANGLQRFWNITFPMLAPSLTVTCMMTMIGSLKVFDVIFAMTGGGPGHATETITTVLINKGFTDGNYAYGSAIGVVLFLLIACISLVELRFLLRREERLQ